MEDVKECVSISIVAEEEELNVHVHVHSTKEKRAINEQSYHSMSIKKKMICRSSWDREIAFMEESILSYRN